MGIINKIKAIKEIGADNFDSLVAFIKDKLQRSINGEKAQDRRQLKTILHNINHAKNRQEVFAALSALASTAFGYELVESVINSGVDMTAMTCFALISIASAGTTYAYNRVYKKNHNKIIDYINSKSNSIQKSADGANQINGIEVGEESKNAVVESGINELSKKYSGMGYHLDV